MRFRTAKGDNGIDTQSSSPVPFSRTKVELAEGSKRSSEPQLSQRVLVISMALLPVSKITYPIQREESSQENDHSGS